MMDASIRARLDQHNIAAQAASYRTMGGSFEITPGWARGFSGLELPAFNIFLPLSPAGLDDDSLADTAAFFSSREVLYSIELIHDRLPGAPDYLNERRYQPLPPQPAMCLQGLAVDMPLNPEVTVEPVRTVPLLTAFCTLLYQVFDFPVQDMVKFFPVSQLKTEAVQHYLAFAGDRPVSTGTLIYAEGAVSIWNVCTVDHYRQRGAATTLLDHMLADAHDRQCDVAMLYSTAQAYSLFSKFGFEIYTQRQWFLPPDLDYEEE
jgi:ribosomal protein S18 acetylase RimI-like enzyme